MLASTSCFVASRPASAVEPSLFKSLAPFSALIRGIFRDARATHLEVKIDKLQATIDKLQASNDQLQATMALAGKG